MKCPRLYLDQPLQSGGELDLPAGPAAHLRVLRARPGQAVVLFNGDGLDYPGELLALERRRARVALGEARPNKTAPSLPLTLFQGVSKGDRMDTAIQKAVELGVACIGPVFTERSVVRLDERRLARRQTHWQGVIVSACEQCGRAELPRLLPARALPELLAREGAGRRLVLDPGAGHGLTELPPPDADGLSLLVGPEGGLSDQEVASARHAGWTCMRLGPRVLRTETAGIAALAAVQTLWGDMG
ncbi:16S rRNA (uracil(1498)-N(3))-methyltransferase [Methylonatrum kenyense]|uniref:16S rRNA (uracil(1498)-N(3))-methyltransferase n=1 Tax=Methylonatrum kenyense TaxID=455253 RepID=UPI0020C12BCE|nr:16S rRNA (uracil(1498)-N(3))-methyltransferase [Methylonatrum kenyense]MCK8516629.1 16S rRNA (uracil(1498)-N(3))-methyltransferase [Methylonatrum kenyense]